MSVKKNIVANYVGQGAQALMGFAFIPLYIKYLGIEAYGLIGIYALLQSWLVLLDMGMKPALGREMARSTAGAVDSQSIRDLLRSVELVVLALAITVALGIAGASGWLASHWVTAKNIPVKVIAQSFSVMGLVTSLRFIEEIYVSSIVGLQRQVLQNTVTSIMSTVRSLGAVCILAWISPTLTAFFLWQGLISILTVIVFSRVVYRALPPAPLRARFSWSALISIWRFAAGMVAITFLSLMLTQIDKILLSRFLTLEAFAYYALAGGVASSLYTMMGPITGALYPRFTQLAASGDTAQLRELYHGGTQMVAVLMGSAAIVLVFFGDRAVQLWTGNPAMAGKVAPLVGVLALGALFNGLMGVPYQLQIAHGWTGLAIRITIVGVILQVPALLWAIPAYGALGAARIWLVLNVVYVAVGIPLMHRRLLIAEKWRWFREDVTVPLLAAAATAWLLRWILPRGLNKPGEFALLAVTSISVLIASALAATSVRAQTIRYLSTRIRLLRMRTA